MKLRKKAAVILTTAMIAGASSVMVMAGENEMPFIPEYSVVDQTLEGDIEVLEPINLNGQTVVINGNLTLLANLYLDSGTLVVTGDLILNGGYLYVDGGNLLVAGGLIQEGGYLVADGSDTSDPKGGHIEIQSESALNGGTINAGQGGVIIFDKGLDMNGGALKPNYGTIKVLGNLSQDGGEIHGDYGFLEIGGDFYQSAKTNGDSGSIQVDGNWFLQDSRLYVGNGSITAKKDFRIQSMSRNDNGDLVFGSTNACLYMDSAAGHFTVEGSFVTQSSGDYYDNYLTNGTLELKGNFTQLTGGSEANVKNNFNCRSNHKVIFSGTKDQIIYFENPTNSGFNQLIAAEEGNANITAGSISSLAGNVKLKAFTQYGNLSLGEYSLDISGDLTEYGNISGNTGHMTVGGNVLHSDGTLNVQNADITFKGDYRIQTLETGTSQQPVYTTSSGALKMNDANGHLTVEGNLVTQSDGDYYGNSLTNGTLELKGNFTQLAGKEDARTKDNFNCRSDHKVIFSGKKEQTIYFENPTYSGFNILADTPYGKANITAGSISSLGCNATLAGFGQYGSLSLNEYGLTITGDLTEYGNINGGTGSMTVNGNVLHCDGKLSVQNANITFKNDYRIQNVQMGANQQPVYTTSSGTLNMSNSDGYLTVEGDMVTQSSGDYYANYLTDGTLELKGNFTQLAGGSEATVKNNFDCRSNHKVIFSGEKEQIITFENPTNSDFNILAGTPYGKANITAGSISSLGCNATLAGFCQYDSLSLNEYGLTITGDLTEYGNIYGGTGSMTVNGNVLHCSGKLSVQNANITFKGDYRIQNREMGADQQPVYSTSSGTINMSDSNGHLTVEGDLVTQSSGDYYANYLTDGTLELKGNFTQLAGKEDASCKNNFDCRSNHKVIFSGKKEQTIYFENPTNSGFNILADTPYGKANITAGRISSLGCNATLAGFGQYSSLSLNEYELTITGDLTEYGNIYGGTGSMIVNGNVLHCSGILNVQKGEITFKGNYRIQNREMGADQQPVYSTSSGTINMSDSKGYLTVEGDMFTQSSGDYYANYLTDGTLELKGNFTQLAGKEDASCKNNFDCRSNHKVIFSGSNEQTIYFENPTFSGFNILAGTPNTMVNITSGRIAYLGANAILAAFSQYDSLNLGTYTLTVNGNLTENGSINCSTGQMTVNGDMLHTNGTLNINAGNVTMNGDYRIQTVSTADDGTLVYGSSKGTLNMSNSKGSLTVNGNFYTQSSGDYYANYLTDGTLVLRGDFTQLTGGENANVKTNFNCRTNHVTILDGEKTQHIHFSNYDSSKFNTLYMRKERFKDGIFVFNTSVIPGGYYLTYDNLSTVDKDSVTIGEPVTIVGAADAGTAPYTYEFFVRATGAKNWTKLEADTETLTYASFIPDIGYDYELLSVAIDADGTTSQKIFTIHAHHKTGLTGWQKEGTFWLYYNKNGNYVVNAWKQIGGKWYHFDSWGFMQTGWYQENDTYYYLKADGSMAVDEWVENDKYYLDENGKWVKGKKKDVEAGWQESAKGKWYQNADGTYPKNQWIKIDGKWYHFNANGYMQTGWYQENGTYYYLKADGSMAADEWVENDKYYLDASGKWIKGKVKEEAATGTWKKSSKGWWYQNADGTYPKNQWYKIAGKWYHFDANGYMQTGWFKEGSFYYYLKADGSMAANEWVENGKYYIDSKGHWVEGATAENE